MKNQQNEKFASKDSDEYYNSIQPSTPEMLIAVSIYARNYNTSTIRWYTRICKVRARDIVFGRMNKFFVMERVPIESVFILLTLISVGLSIPELDLPKFRLILI